MKERSKERIAALLMEELLEQLAERENIKKMLVDMTPLPMDELIEGLVDEFEKVVENRRNQVLDTARTKKEKRAKQREDSAIRLPRIEDTTLSSLPDHQVAKPTERQQTPLPKISPPEIPVAPLHLTVNPIEVKIPEPAPPQIIAPRKPVDATPLENKKREISESVPSVEPVVDKKKMLSVEEILRNNLRAEEEIEERTEPDVEEPMEAGQEDAGSAGHKHVLLKVPFNFSDDDLVYLHAVAKIPEGETASPVSFMLEEKGIDPRSFAFALDYGDMRFYLSKILTGIMNVSKTGVLLLGKEESMQLRGSHEGILNDLRGHGVLLPFEFGTVARGKDELLGRLDDHLDDLRESLDVLYATRNWMLSVLILDARIAQLVGTDESGGRMERTRDRASYTKTAQPKKYDIKLLERILNKEKKVAESVHSELEQVAESSEIEMIVGLGSGSSDDWKPILKASYEVAPQNVQKFNRAITDMQYHHMVFDLMLSLTGDCENYSLSRR